MFAAGSLKAAAEVANTAAHLQLSKVSTRFAGFRPFGLPLLEPYRTGSLARAEPPGLLLQDRYNLSILIEGSR